MSKKTNKNDEGVANEIGKWILKKCREQTTKEEWLQKFYSFLWNTIDEIDSPNTNIEDFIRKITNCDCLTFREFRNKMLSKENITYNQESLDKINVMLYILFNTEIKTRYSSKIIKFFEINIYQYEMIDYKRNIDIYTNFTYLKEELSYYNLNIDKNFVVSFKDEKYLLDKIEEYDKTLSDLFYDYRSSKSFEEKEKNITNLAKKIVFIFDENKSSKATNFFYKKIGKKETIDFRKKLNGYFRHTPNDSNGNEVKEWEKLNQADKERIMENMFVDILYYCVLLRTNDIDINKIN